MCQWSMMRFNLLLDNNILFQFLYYLIFNFFFNKNKTSCFAQLKSDIYRKRNKSTFNWYELRRYFCSAKEEEEESKSRFVYSIVKEEEECQQVENID